MVRAADDAVATFGPLSGPFPRDLVRASVSLTQPTVPAYGPSLAKQAIVWGLRHLPRPIIHPAIRIVCAVWPGYRIA
jgi:hypothetical protein